MIHVGLQCKPYVPLYNSIIGFKKSKYTLMNWKGNLNCANEK